MFRRRRERGGGVEDPDVSDDLPGEPKAAKQAAQGVRDRLHAGAIRP